MSPQKNDAQSSGASGSTRAAKGTQQAPQEKRISSPARFLFVVLSSLVLSSGLFTLTSRIHLDELRTVGKPLNSWLEVGGLLAWRAVEVGLTWLLGYDGISHLNLLGREDANLTDRTRCAVVYFSHAASYIHPAFVVLSNPPHHDCHCVRDHVIFLHNSICFLPMFSSCA